MSVLQCARWKGSVCVSGICRCPQCGCKKYCYALRQPEEPEPACPACKDQVKREEVTRGA